jgi:hypothetical protein
MIQKIVGVYCGANELLQSYAVDHERGWSRAKAELASSAGPKVCRVARERYGENGARLSGRLVPAR